MDQLVALTNRCRATRTRKESPGRSVPSGSIRVSHIPWSRQARDHDDVRRTVLIVDDDDAFRASARALLEGDGFDVIAETADGEQAIQAVAAFRPDIVLLDIQLPGPNGYLVAEQLAEAPDPPMVVLMSSRDTAAYGASLPQASARGFVTKNALSGEALAALVR